jgi:serine/threonine protein kinase
MILGKYETKKRLGKGAFGDVFLAQDKNKNLFAVKMISLRSFAG